MAADIDVTIDDLSVMAGTIVSVNGASITAVPVTLGPIRKEADTQDVGIFHNSDLECVGVASDFSSIPDERAVLGITCSGLSLSATNFVIDSKEVDAAGFRFMLKRMT